MQRKIIKPFLLVLFLIATGFAQAQHDSTNIDNLEIGQPWSRAMPPTAHTGAVFVSIHNSGQNDQLISAYSPIAEQTELHNHIHQNGLMKMVQVQQIKLPANATVQLEPGSYHIMLIGLKQPLIEGEFFPVRLEFANAGIVELQAVVKSMHGTDRHMHH